LSVDDSADPYDQKYIDNFTEAEIIQFVRLFEDPDFTVDFSTTKGGNVLMT
jgi:hypothetical protein